MPCALLLPMLLAAAGCGGNRGTRVNDVTEPLDAPPSSVMSRHPIARRYFDKAAAQGMPREGVLLLVRVSRQTMDMVVADTVITTFPVSTSRHGTGNRQHSYRTPLGLHEVVARFGQDEPAGRVFRGRVATQEQVPPADWTRDASEDLVLSRILWLRGREPGNNAGPGIDSYERFIYIHGTNEEHRLGQPASKGCIRMANQAVIDLFHAVENRPVWCWIIE